MLIEIVVEDAVDVSGEVNQRVPRPGWQVVRTAILAMDGEHRSLLKLSSSEDEFMGIGGGSNGLLCCFIVDEAGEEYALVDPKKQPTEFVTFLMGQLSTRSNDELMDVDTILKAANWYFEHGKPHPDLRWRQY